MHIPDGFLDPIIAATTYLIFLTYIGYSIYKIHNKIDPNTISLLTVIAAGIFAAQMLNWPLPGGTKSTFCRWSISSYIAWSMAWSIINDPRIGNSMPSIS